MKLTDLIKAYIMYPVIMSIITLILLIVAWVHRKRLWPYIQQKFKFLRPQKNYAPIATYCQDFKHILQFKNELVFEDNKPFIDSMQKFITKEKKSGHCIIFDLTNVELVNDAAQEGLRTIFRTIIKENNIRAFLFFPDGYLQDLYNELRGCIKECGCASVEIKRGKKALKLI